MQCEKDFSSFKVAYNGNNVACDNMIKEKMKNTGRVFTDLIRESRADLAFLKTQLLECIGETDTLEDLIDGLEVRITKNEEVVGFKNYVDQPEPVDEDMTIA